VINILAGERHLPASAVDTHFQKTFTFSAVFCDRQPEWDCPENLRVKLVFDFIWIYLDAHLLNSERTLFFRLNMVTISIQFIGPIMVSGSEEII
jgi:hypothetical protein